MRILLTLCAMALAGPVAAQQAAGTPRRIEVAVVGRAPLAA